MNFIREYHSDRQIVPTFHFTVVSNLHRMYLKLSIHAFVRSIVNCSLYITLSKEIFFRRLFIAGIWTNIGNNTLFVKSLPEGQCVKISIRIIENTIQSNPASIQLDGYAVDAIVYLIQVGMVAILTFGHCQRKSLSVGKINRIGRLRFFRP